MTTEQALKEAVDGTLSKFGPEGANAADFIFLYEEPAVDASGKIYDREEAKKESADAYEKVGSTAHLKGNLVRAKKLMTYLGYTPEHIEVAGQDAFNY